jgi:hypothetical protein
MSAPRLIICERSPRWLAAWRRALPARHWNWLASAVSLTQSETRLRESPGSVVAVNIDAENLPTALLKLHHWRRDFPQARFLALLSHELTASPETLVLLQEAGVMLIIDRNQQLRAAARLVRRHFQGHARRSAGVELPLREAIWQRLPWPQFATQPQTT